MQIYKGLSKVLQFQSKQLKNYNKLPALGYKQCFTFSQLSHNQELKALADMLGMKNQKVNEEIGIIGGDIRLVSQTSKQLGVFTFEQALQQTQSKGLDLVLVSDAVKPIICKATNYKEFLYKKFIDEVIKKDPSFKKRKTKKSEKKIQISTKISMGDLKNKAQQTIELAKKFEKFEIFLYCTDKTVENSKNLLYTFADLVREELSTEDNELKEVEVDVNYLSPEEYQDEDEVPTRKVGMTFISSSYVQSTSEFSEEEIRQLIAQYFSKSKSQYEHQDIVDDIVSEQRGEAQEKLMQGQVITEYGDKSFDDIVKENMMNENDQEDYSEDIMQSMSGFVQDTTINPEELQQEIEELKLKYNTGAQDALLQDIIRGQEKKLADIQRIQKLLHLH